jgi:hypothetical protein
MCRPVVGSSSMNTFAEPSSCTASFRRWRSPPDSVRSGWPSVT